MSITANSVADDLFVLAVLLTGLAVYYLAEFWRWRQDRRAGAIAREAARNATPEDLSRWLSPESVEYLAARTDKRSDEKEAA